MKKFLSLILIFSCGGIQAATVQLNGDNNAIAIIGLHIDGSFYDVEFGPIDGPYTAGYQSWAHIFGSDSDSLATLAVSDMASLLVAADADGIAYPDGTVMGQRLGIWVEDQGYGGLCPTPGFNTTIWADGYDNWTLNSFNCIDAPNTAFTSPAFKASAVPIPAAVWLFGSALAGLGWLRRKQTL